MKKNKFLSFDDLSKRLEFSSKDEEELNKFLNAVVNYSSLIPIGKNIAEVKFPDTKKTWEDLAKSFFSELVLTDDFSTEQGFKNLVSQIIAAREQNDGYGEHSISIVLNKIGKNSIIADFAVNHNIDFETAKAEFDLLSKSYTKKYTRNSFNSTAYTNDYQPQPKKNRNQPKFVYIAKQLNEKNLYKIGCSDTLEQRLRAFKIGNCFIEIIASKQVNDKYYYEKYFHKYFKSKHYKGEWYKLTDDDLFDLANIFNFNFHIKTKRSGRK